MSSPRVTQFRKLGVSVQVLRFVRSLVFRAVFGVVLVGLAVVWLGWRYRLEVDLGRVVRLLNGVQWGYVVLAGLAYYGSFPLRSRRWHFLLAANHGLATAHFSWHQLLPPYLYSWLMNCLIPAKTGEVYRCYYAHRRLNVPLASALSSILLERTTDFLLLAVLLSFSSVVVFGQHVSQTLVLLQLIAAGLAVSLLLGLVALRSSQNFHRFLPTVVQRPLAALAATLTLNRREAGTLVLFSLPLWFLEGFRVFAEARALGITLTPALALLIALIAALLTTLPLTPAGIGAVELGIAGTLIFFQVPFEQAIALALLDRLVAYWSVFPIAGVPWFFTYIRGR